jgi:histidyl-tRNA synthetase
MYTFSDRADKEGNGKSLTLRPEVTAGIVRAYLEHGMFTQAQPVKLYSPCVSVFRHERPQAGRFREHHQFDVEALGSSDPALDAEVIAIASFIYTQLGLKNILLLNSIGDNNCRPQYIQTLKAYYQPILADCCDDCTLRFEKSPLRLLDCKNSQDQEKIRNAPKITDHLCEECRTHFVHVQKYLTAYHIPYTLDSLIVRGLDYYTRTVFEFLPDGGGSALGGGGRYDGLAEVLGGGATPGVGFAAGIERNVLEMQKHTIIPENEGLFVAYIVYMPGNDSIKYAAVEMLAEIRRAGIKADMSYGDRSLKAQMRQANAVGALYALIIGEEELATNSVTVRTLRDSSDTSAHTQDVSEENYSTKQESVPRTNVLLYIQNLHYR